MKHQRFFLAVQLLIATLIFTACSSQQPTPTTTPQTATKNVQNKDTNQMFTDFLSTNQDEIKNQILITCKTAYPNIVITDIQPNLPINYVIDQNPTTVNYEPTLEQAMDDQYSATVKNGEFTLYKNGTVVTDTNIIGIVSSQGLTANTINVAVELQFTTEVLIKSISCTIK